MTTRGPANPASPSNIAAPAAPFEPMTATASAATPQLLADMQLVERLRAKDPRACEQFVREHGGRMLGVAQRFFDDENDANDAVQDAFLSAFTAVDRFAGHSALSTWLHRITVNACLMKIRGRKAEVSIDELLPKFDSTGHHAASVATWDDTVAASAERAETASIVRAAIAELPEPYRTVIHLRDIEELDTLEAARVLGCTAGNVKTRLHRARQALRTLLERRLAQ